MIIVWTQLANGKSRGAIGHVSHHLISLLGVIALTFLFVFVRKVGYFAAQTRETLLYK
jgi:ACR3 family arsenite efflux pump ArsB